MIKYKKVYCTFFDYDYGDHIQCEVCRYNFDKKQDGVIFEAVDIHHIKARGMGGSKCCNINEIPNLVALCRNHHQMCEDDKSFNRKVRVIHLKNIINRLEQ